LKDAAPEAREVGVLLASELVTNAVLYSQGRIVLEVEPRDATYRICIHDPMPCDLEPRHTPVSATSGRGLLLVEQLAQSWGVQSPVDSGKEVWFEVPRT
jgi:anti-sigma regulatory factor (Ser/Thr protein kinase)